MHLIKRIEEKPKIELALALVQQVLVGFGPQLDVEGILAPIELRLGDEGPGNVLPLQARNDTRGRKLGRRSRFEVQVRNLGRILNRPDQFSKILAQCLGIAPAAHAHDLALRVQHVF